MEVDNLISALEETLNCLRNSVSSDYAHMPVEEIIKKLELELAKVKMSLPLNANLLSFLFAPTGAIQDTAIDNGWGDEFLKLAEVINRFISSK